MKLTIYVIICLVLINFISHAYGCSCAFSTNQEMFCSATFVSKGKVTGIKNLEGNKFEYTVAVNHSFKIKVPNTLKVRSGDPFMCGVDLQKGVVYLISGYVSGSTYHTNNCHWNQEWQSIKSDTRKKLFKGQFNNC
ncbi:NTR domain-containing protein-like [Mytilus trossulus]|uniref:NTR domain-containing protein-like n=1 Tax=Mytilus trossulus TaxID=6551 RepID=UPI003004A1EE